ncbi:MAG: response regulator [Endomicrobiales bacterium]|nr:response regulator [Endomicrobiales bacterium]
MSDGKNKKILVIDDEPNLQEMLKDILSIADFNVITASNGLEGLKAVYEQAPDLIILDCSMPVLDGYETLERMRSDPLLRHKPVIMLSVNNTEYDEIKGLKLGVDDYITKPFKASLLIARVKAILERNTQSVSANPLTLLSGNEAIKREAEKRIHENTPFAMIYIDLDNFKAFNDKYGFERGDDVIKYTAHVLLRAVREDGQKGDFIGHIGGDDFIIITSIETYQAVAEKTIKIFDANISEYYDAEDRKRGFIISLDREKKERQFPLISVSIGVINTQQTKIVHYGQLSQIAAELKKIAKQTEGSSYVVDRRKGVESESGAQES